MASLSCSLSVKLLDARRRQLGMSYAVLAKKSCVSVATVVRILSDKHPTASFNNVVAIAETLGLCVRFDATAGVDGLRERQAQQKAVRLVEMVQGTSGLEGQALDDDTLGEMTRRTTHELLAGSRRKLWDD